MIDEGALVCPFCKASNPEAATFCGGCGEFFALSLQPGALLASRYEVRSLVGRGGMGVVYRAYDRILDDDIALKVLRPDANGANLAKRIRSEIKLARHIRHPNVCAIHDYGEDGQWRFISMELIEGMDLKQLIRNRGALSIDDGYDAALQIGAGLAAVHQAGIIHRDLKAANIMIDAAGTVRLMDFGIARRVAPGTAASVTLTGQIVGSPEYMSPEQARGESLDVRSDIYSLGVVLFEVFGGKVPFQGDTPVATILKHLQEPPPLEPERRGRIPEAMCPVLRKALAKSRDDRYASVHEMAAEIDARRREGVRLGATPTATQYRFAVPSVPSSVKHGPLASGVSWKRVAVAVGVVVIAAAAVILPARMQPANGPESMAAPPAASVIPSSAASVDDGREARPPTPAPDELVRVSPSPPQVAAASPPTVMTRKEAVRTPPLTPWSPLPLDIPPVADERQSAPLELAKEPLVLQPSPTAPPVPTTTVPTPGILRVHVVPWADVEVNGRNVGQTPFEPLSLPAGTYVVRFVHPDYHPLTRQVVVITGVTVRVSVDFTWEGFLKQ